MSSSSSSSSAKVPVPPSQLNALDPYPPLGLNQLNELCSTREKLQPSLFAPSSNTHSHTPVRRNSQYSEPDDLSMRVDIEFDVLTQLSVTPEYLAKIYQATHHQTLKRNRYNNVLPNKLHRVLLKHVPNDHGSDYINASHIYPCFPAPAPAPTPTPTPTPTPASSSTATATSAAAHNQTSSSSTSSASTTSSSSSSTSSISSSSVSVCGTISSPYHSYIAAQAPLPNSMSHFWQMVWEQGSHLIVMLTKLVERDRQGKVWIKAHKYWPGDESQDEEDDDEDDEEQEQVQDEEGNYVMKQAEQTNKKSKQYEAFHVTLVSTRKEEDWILKEIELTHTITTPSSTSSSASTSTPVQNNSRTIFLLQYTSWPDHGVAKLASFASMFSVYRRIRDQFAQAHLDIGPIIVHCSAGIGRTGTFCAIDLILDYIKSCQRSKVTPHVNVFGVVHWLRESRGGMVQSAAQYEFIFLFVHYALKHKLFEVSY